MPAHRTGSHVSELVPALDALDNTGRLRQKAESYLPRHAHIATSEPPVASPPTSARPPSGGAGVIAVPRRRPSAMLALALRPRYSVPVPPVLLRRLGDADGSRAGHFLRPRMKRPGGLKEGGRADDDRTTPTGILCLPPEADNGQPTHRWNSPFLPATRAARRHRGIEIDRGHRDSMLLIAATALRQ